MNEPSDGVKQKRCIFCKKLFVNNKGLVCLRCKLKGRNTTGKIAKNTLKTVGFAFSLYGAGKFAENYIGDKNSGIT